MPDARVVGRVGLRCGTAEVLRHTRAVPLHPRRAPPHRTGPHPLPRLYGHRRYKAARAEGTLSAQGHLPSSGLGRRTKFELEGAAVAAVRKAVRLKAHKA